MAAVAHLGIGFAAKPLAPKVLLWVMLVASELLDILWIGFYFTGVDRNFSIERASPFSHGLLMSAIFGGRVLSPDLPLFFSGSRRVGFGLYNHSYLLAAMTDVAIFLVGFAIYRNYKKGRAGIENY